MTSNQVQRTNINKNDFKEMINFLLFLGSTEVMHDTENLTVVEHCHDPGKIRNVEHQINKT